MNVYLLAQQLTTLAAASTARISIRYAGDNIRVIVATDRAIVYDRRSSDYIAVVSGAIAIVTEIAKAKTLDGEVAA